MVEQSDVTKEKEEVEMLQEKQVFNELFQQIRKKKEGEEIDSIWYAVYQYFLEKEEWKQTLQNSMKALEYTNIPAPIEKDMIHRLYGDTLKTSISRLEKYSACPFSFYLQYGLKLSTKTKLKVERINTGTFMHDVIDTFFERIAEKQIPLKELSLEDMQAEIEKIVEEKLSIPRNYLFTSTPKYKVLVNRLKKVLLQSIYYIVQSLVESDFTILGNEIEFKQGSKYKPMVLTTEEGQKIEITGKIDRMDIAKTEKGDYIRIIDYKSSVKDLDVNEVVAGLRLQLLTYLEEACKIEEKNPAGVLYFNLIEPVLKTSRNSTKEEIEKEIRKRFKMKGLILADVEVIKKMDTTLQAGASDKIPAYLDKEGNISMGKSSCVTKEQFEYLQQYTNKLIQKIAKEMLKGNITLMPYYKLKDKTTACQYCEYKSICQFNKAGCKNAYRYIPYWDKQVVLENIKEKLGGNK